MTPPPCRHRSDRPAPAATIARSGCGCGSREMFTCERPGFGRCGALVTSCEDKRDTARWCGPGCPGYAAAGGEDEP